MGKTTILALPHSYELLMPFQQCLDPWVPITNLPEPKVQSCLQLKGKVCILKSILENPCSLISINLKNRLGATILQ